MIKWQTWDGRVTYVVDRWGPNQWLERLCPVCVARLDLDICQPCAVCGVYTHRCCVTRHNAPGEPFDFDQTWRCVICDRTD